MKILFLGGTRFIGPHEVKRLVEAGHEVAVCNRGQPLFHKVSSLLREIVPAWVNTGRLFTPLHLITAKIRRELGYTEQATAEESIRRTIAWELEHPPENMLQENNYIIEDKLLAKLCV